MQDAYNKAGIQAIIIAPALMKDDVEFIFFGEGIEKENCTKKYIEVMKEALKEARNRD